MPKEKESALFENLGVIVYIAGSLLLVSLLTCNEDIRIYLTSYMQNILNKFGLWGYGMIILIGVVMLLTAVPTTLF